MLLKERKMRITLGLIALTLMTTCSNPRNNDIQLESPLTNILWIGIFQPIKIEGAPEGYQIKIQGGEKIASLKKEGSLNEFQIRPNRLGNLVIEIRIGQEIWKEEFDVREIPNLVGEICSYQSGMIPRATLLNCGGITVTSENYGIDINYRVKKFDLYVIKNGKGKTYSSNSRMFTNEQLNELKNMPKGSRFYLENIEVITGLGRIRSVPIMRFELEV